MSLFGRWLIVAVGAVVLSACAETRLIVHTAKRVVNVSKPQEKSPPRGTYKIGDPYQIGGAWYYPSVDYDYDETGIASWYGAKFHGRPTANGEIYDMNGLSAAHRTLPLPSIVRVTNLDNGRSLVVRVNDRGPFARGRIVDASRRSAQLLGFERAGTAKVRVQILARESRILAARLNGEVTLADVGTPITVARLPKAPVTSQALEPVPGAKAAPAPKENAADRVAIRPAGVPPPAADAGPSAIVSGDVSVVAVGATELFIQPGAYRHFENANRVRAILAPVGRVKVYQELIGGRDLFRVRVGPLATVEEADKVLDMVIGAGYSDARVVIE
ncbi:MAG: septal ring lytic transglycosylase RlpA family protein [Rhodospirillales bacterium]|nr:septal ring lytic transglycosylase RlpA family protein [Rhodospirillales bacterium]